LSPMLLQNPPAGARRLRRLSAGDLEFHFEF
jgi:hypothetical protein